MSGRARGDGIDLIMKDPINNLGPLGGILVSTQTGVMGVKDPDDNKRRASNPQNSIEQLYFKLAREG